MTDYVIECQEGCVTGTAFPFADTRCPECGCCNHVWRDDCPCPVKECGCWENREWDEEQSKAVTS